MCPVKLSLIRFAFSFIGILNGSFTFLIFLLFLLLPAFISIFSHHPIKAKKKIIYKIIGSTGNNLQLIIFYRWMVRWGCTVKTPVVLSTNILFRILFHICSSLFVSHWFVSPIDDIKLTAPLLYYFTLYMCVLGLPGTTTLH